ncbi:MAG: hypothetical protein LBG75_03080 [Candidatus Nomurabacteria bacterium]|jgi:hypothetical protein|nr:hypothetical protein [Candidatus Nomurabacteria bacterium]
MKGAEQSITNSQPESQPPESAYGRFARKIARVCCIAANIENSSNPDHEFMAKSLIVERFFRQTRSSSLVLAILAGNSHMIGGGYSSLVSKEGELVHKRSINHLGASEEAIEQEVSLKRQQMDVLEQVTSLYVPTSFGSTTLDLFPLGSVRTAESIQEYVEHDYDIFNAPTQVVESESFQTDLAELVSTNRQLLNQGYYLDLVGADNIVVHQVDADPRIKILDTGFMKASKLHNLTNSGLTLQQHYDRRVNLLENLQK